MKEEYRRWFTPHLNRHFEMLVFGHAGYPVMLFPTSRARYFQYKDFGLIECARPLLDAGLIKIYTPDGIDDESWYNYGIHPADRVRTHIAYENVIVHDVIPFIRDDSGSPAVAVGGCSFGGYHAANLGFRHPHLVGYMISMSGAYDIKQFIMGYYDDNCYFNNPADFLPGVEESDYLDRIRRMGIILGVGGADICLEENRQLSGILSAKAIPHWLDVRNGVHDWPLWREMFPAYLWSLLQKEGKTG
jgi:esterase/lipase superfamily enzyme